MLFLMARSKLLPSHWSSATLSVQDILRSTRSSQCSWPAFMELITEVTWKTFLTWATRNIPYGKRTIFCNFHFFTISSPFHIVFQNISVSKKTTCFCFGIQKLSLASLHHAKFDIVSFCGLISLLSTPWFGNIPTKEASREQKRSKQNLPAKILAGGGEWLR